MALEKLAKDQQMNTREIRMQHYVEMNNLEHNYYDRAFISDN